MLILVLVVSVSCLGNCLHCWCISGYSMLTLSQVPCLVLYWVLWSTWLIFEQGNKYRSICSPTPFLVRPAPFIKNAFLDFQHVFLFFYQKIKKKIFTHTLHPEGSFSPSLLHIFLPHHEKSSYWFLYFMGCPSECMLDAVNNCLFWKLTAFQLFPDVFFLSLMMTLYLIISFQSWKQGSY